MEALTDKEDSGVQISPSRTVLSKALDIESRTKRAFPDSSIERFLLNGFFVKSIFPAEATLVYFPGLKIQESFEENKFISASFRCVLFHFHIASKTLLLLH